MHNLAIIPARSGSKGIKDKNIIKLSGKPLLEYSVDAAIISDMFECVHVSTDSAQYAELAIQSGADVPFLRDNAFSTDETDSWSVVRFVLDQYRNLGRWFDTVTLLQPTSPLRNAEDIKNAFNLLLTKNADAVISVSEEKHSPMLTNTLDETLSLDNFIDLGRVKRRQDMPVYYRVNGAIYMLRTFILDNIMDLLYGKNSYAYIMPESRSVDIDSMYDLKMAEIMLEENKCLK